MNSRIFYLFVSLFLLYHVSVSAQDEIPAINPVAVFHYASGDEESTEGEGDAPLRFTLKAQPMNAEGWRAEYEWRIYRKDEYPKIPELVRYEENTDVVLSEAGTHIIILMAKFTDEQQNEVYYDSLYWSEASTLTATVKYSKLEFPNAFSPNGDNVNDIYCAKSGYQSIIEFHAIIFNRWGQRLYEWDDPAGGWDGTYNGKPVREGVYFVKVHARGADGIIYDIKRDVNLLRGYTEAGAEGGIE